MYCSRVVTCWRYCSVGGSTAPWGSWQRWGRPEHISWLFLEDEPTTFYQPLWSLPGCSQYGCWLYLPAPATDSRDQMCVTWNKKRDACHVQSEHCSVTWNMLTQKFSDPPPLLIPSSSICVEHVTSTRTDSEMQSTRKHGVMFHGGVYNIKLNYEKKERTSEQTY